jgi:hypothetical protein
VDLRQVAERLVPSGDRLEGVKYFTSQISAKASEDPDSPSRQRLFIRAARATPDVEVFEGKFQVPEGWRSMTSKGSWDGRLRPPLPQHVLGADEAHSESHDRRPWKARVELPQEKFTDVAIASHLLRDYYRGDCAYSIVVSNDSDLSPAVQLAVDDGPHRRCVQPDEHRFAITQEIGDLGEVHPSRPARPLPAAGRRFDSRLIADRESASGVEKYRGPSEEGPRVLIDEANRVLYLASISARNALM